MLAFPRCACPGRQSRRLDALIQAGFDVSARLALADILQASAEIACDLAGSSQVAVVLSGSGGELQSRASACRGGDEATIEALSERLLGAVREHRRAIKISSPVQGEGGAPGESEAEVLAVPIVVEEQLLGCLCFYGKPGGFSADDEATAMTLAAQVGVAVVNAREYEDPRASAQRLEALNDIERAILEGWGTDEILRSPIVRARSSRPTWPPSSFPGRSRASWRCGSRTGCGPKRCLASRSLRRARSRRR